MKTSRFSETQIITILRQGESGLKVKDLCLEHGISDATYYNWKAKYGGLESSDLKRLKEYRCVNMDYPMFLSVPQTQLHWVRQNSVRENWMNKGIIKEMEVIVRAKYDSTQKYPEDFFGEFWPSWENLVVLCTGWRCVQSAVNFSPMLSNPTC